MNVADDTAIERQLRKAEFQFWTRVSIIVALYALMFFFAVDSAGSLKIPWQAGIVFVWVGFSFDKLRKLSKQYFGLAGNAIKWKKFRSRQILFTTVLTFTIALLAVPLVSRLSAAQEQKQVYKQQSERLKSLMKKYPEMQSWRGQIHELVHYETKDIHVFILRRSAIEELLDKFEPSCKETDAVFSQMEAESLETFQPFVAATHRSIKLDNEFNALMREEISYAGELKNLSANMQRQELQNWKRKFSEFQERERRIEQQQATAVGEAQRDAAAAGLKVN